MDSSDAVVATLRQIIRAIDLRSRELIKKHGLTGPQLLVLKEIQKDPFRPISKIASEISLSQATVTSIIDRLEQQDLAVRNRNSSDRRKVNISLTEKGIAILKSNPSMLQEEFSDKFNSLKNWEKTMILSSLQRLASLLNAEKIHALPVLVSGPLDTAVSDSAENTGDKHE